MTRAASPGVDPELRRACEISLHLRALREERRISRFAEQPLEHLGDLHERIHLRSSSHRLTLRSMSVTL